MLLFIKVMKQVSGIRQVGGSAGALIPSAGDRTDLGGLRRNFNVSTYRLHEMATRPDAQQELVNCWQKSCLRPTSFWMSWALLLCGGCRSWSCVISAQDY